MIATVVEIILRNTTETETVPKMMHMKINTNSKYLKAYNFAQDFKQSIQGMHPCKRFKIFLTKFSANLSTNVLKKCTTSAHEWKTRSRAKRLNARDR
jgi:hypothetical protein